MYVGNNPDIPTAWFNCDFMLWLAMMIECIILVGWAKGNYYMSPIYSIMAHDRVLYILDNCASDRRLDVEKTTVKYRTTQTTALSVSGMMKTSTVTQMLVMLVVVVRSSPVPVHRGRVRVGRPCSGRNVVELTSTTDNDDRLNSHHHHLRRSVHSVTSHLAALHDALSRLRAHYVCSTLNNRLL